MANQVAHEHECPACRGDEVCFAPECRALTYRVCRRCMETAWLHGRRAGRPARPGVPESQAA
jgi:hypothetical protein